ncbi:MAG: hypothetical protein LBR26_17125, partial [Prevotella sp.]|nr:hypothetical protein [Prevotella sp.]
VQAREHVKRLKIQAGHLFTTQRIDAKQHDDVFRQADSLLSRLSDWQEAGAAPPAAPLMSEHDLQD